MRAQRRASAHRIDDQTLVGKKRFTTIITTQREPQTLLASAEACVITRLGRELPNAASHLLRFLGARMRAFRTTGAR
jgi:hypothetical protein